MRSNNRLAAAPDAVPPTSRIGKLELGFTVGVALLAMLLFFRAQVIGVTSDGRKVGWTVGSDSSDTGGALPQPATLERWYRLAQLQGDPGAPIQIIEFANFLCSYCRALHFALDTISSRYPGLVAVRWLHFVEPAPTMTGSNRFLAISAECAADQGAFQVLADALFRAGAGVSSRRGVLDIVGRIPEVDETAFVACLDSGVHEHTVDEHNILVREAGYAITPMWFLNGKAIAGALPVRVIDSLIVAELRQGRK